jgi:hypothetical protein
MYIPSGRDRVRLVGRNEVFFVLAVDLEKCRPDVIPLDGDAYVEPRVPFEMIKPYEERSAARRDVNGAGLVDSRADMSSMGSE